MSLRVLTLSLAVAGLAACAPGKSAPAAAAPGPTTPSAQRIADAMTTHDRRCSVNARPAQPDRVASELGIDRCRTPIDSEELGLCLHEIDDAPCDAPASAHLDRLPTCRLGAVCGATDEGSL